MDFLLSPHQNASMYFQLTVHICQNPGTVVTEEISYGEQRVGMFQKFTKIILKKIDNMATEGCMVLWFFAVTVPEFISRISKFKLISNSASQTSTYFNYYMIAFLNAQCNFANFFVYVSKSLLTLDLVGLIQDNWSRCDILRWTS